MQGSYAERVEPVVQVVHEGEGRADRDLREHWHLP